MTTKPLLILAGTLFAVSTAFAQGAGAGGEGSRQSAGGGQANTSAIPGWSTMNAQERSEMQKRMQSFRNYNECKSHMSEHSQRMDSQRMGSRGLQSAPPAAGVPGGTSGAATTTAAAADPCGHLPRS